MSLKQKNLEFPRRKTREKKKSSLRNKTENLKNKKNARTRKNLRKPNKKAEPTTLISNTSLPLKRRHAKKLEYSWASMEIQTTVGEKDTECYVHPPRLINLKESPINPKEERSKKRR